LSSDLPKGEDLKKMKAKKRKKGKECKTQGKNALNSTVPLQDPQEDRENRE